MSRNVRAEQEGRKDLPTEGAEDGRREEEPQPQAPPTGRGVETPPLGPRPPRATRAAARPQPLTWRSGAAPPSELAGSGGVGLPPHPEAEAGLWAPALGPGTVTRVVAKGTGLTCLPKPPSF